MLQVTRKFFIFNAEAFKGVKKEGGLIGLKLDKKKKRKKLKRKVLFVPSPEQFPSIRRREDILFKTT